MASGRLRLEDAAQGSQLAGDVTVESAELRIPEGLPPEIVKLDVIEVNAPPGRKPAAEPARASAAPPLGLAVTVRIPGRAFLRGRGLESEWRGKLRVAGTMAAPDITGRLEVVRGRLDLLGTPFDVESGTVTFIGGDKIDPELDFTAGAEANDINARVRVTGFASAPKFEIGSDSGLPPEEAMSRLLFGQSAGSLSPGQAVQLAQAAATLSGGGPGVLDKLRSSVGLDVLSVESGGASPNDTRLKAGKYVSDKVFLKVEQGVTAESREVGVEVRVLPRVTVEGGVGHEGSGKVGVNWRYDY
jgi:translocation and assembly module TamB